MRYRNLILVPLFLFTAIYGVALSMTDSGTAGPLLQNFFKSALWSPVAYLFGLRPDGLALLWDENKGLIFYGGVGVFGLLMVGLVLRSALKPQEDKIEASLLRALIQEKEKAERTAKIKSEFLTQVSHELRTPLAVIIGYLDCLIEGLYGEIGAKHKEILETISKQSGELKTMIDQILLFSRLEAGRHEASVEIFSLNDITEELRETFEFLAHQKGIEMRWHVPPDLPALQTDPERLKEILNNLSQNAVKYTERGSIWVRIQYLALTDSIVAEVTDTGIGIPPAALETVFDPFVQAHKQSAYEPRNGVGGIGMGLAIVKKHVEQLNGTITVESRLHHGTSFKVVIPRVLVKEEKQERKAPSGLLKLLRGSGLNGKPSAGADSSENSEQRTSAAASGGGRH